MQPVDLFEQFALPRLVEIDVHPKPTRFVGDDAVDVIERQSEFSVTAGVDVEAARRRRWASGLGSWRDRGHRVLDRESLCQRWRAGRRGPSGAGPNVCRSYLYVW